MTLITAEIHQTGVDGSEALKRYLAEMRMGASTVLGTDRTKVTA